jgi:putative addiction module component (TIGR02574 family)
MPRSVADLEREIQDLSVQERARLAAFILASLDEIEDEGVEDAWAREIEERVTAYERGEVVPVPADDVLAEARRRKK